jgi:hypothetical protein
MTAWLYTAEVSRAIGGTDPCTVPSSFRRPNTVVCSLVKGGFPASTGEVQGKQERAFPCQLKQTVPSPRFSMGGGGLVRGRDGLGSLGRKGQKMCALPERPQGGLEGIYPGREDFHLLGVQP